MSWNHESRCEVMIRMKNNFSKMSVFVDGTERVLPSPWVFLNRSPQAAKEDPTIGALTTTRPSISTAPNGALGVSVFVFFCWNRQEGVSLPNKLERERLMLKNFGACFFPLQQWVNHHYFSGPYYWPSKFNQCFCRTQNIPKLYWLKATKADRKPDFTPKSLHIS